MAIFNGFLYVYQRVPKCTQFQVSLSLGPSGPIQQVKSVDDLHPLAAASEAPDVAVPPVPTVLTDSGADDSMATP